MAKIAPSGITGNTSFGRLINDTRVFETGKKAMEIMFDKTGAPKHGFFTVDMKEDDAGNPLITEINVRHVAFTQCLAMGGANLCEDTIRLLTEDDGFDKEFRLYTFEEGLIFLRDVDERPILMFEKDLLPETKA
jgi:carbamoyl-phosphate synthase large subunit